MDLWGVGSLIASVLIEIGVAWQLYFIIKNKRSEGLSLLSWYGYAVALSYLAIFTIVKNQHWTLILNYCCATVMHLLTAIAAHYYKKN